MQRIASIAYSTDSHRRANHLPVARPNRRAEQHASANDGSISAANHNPAPNRRALPLPDPGLFSFG